MLQVHRGICKDNITLYLAAFKAYMRSRGMSPVKAKETLKLVFIFMALPAIQRKSPSPKSNQSKRPATIFLFMRVQALLKGIIFE